MDATKIIWSAFSAFGAGKAVRRFGKLGRRTGIAIAGVICLALSTIAILTVTREHHIEDAKQNIAKVNLILAHDTAKTIQAVDRVLLDIQQEIADRGIARIEALQLLVMRDTHDDFRRRMAGIEPLAALILTNGEGDVINSSREFPVLPRSVADRDYFKQMRANPRLSFLISPPVQNLSTGEWTIVVVRRIRGPDLQGLILGAISLKHIEDFYREIYMGDDIGISLWRSDFTLLARFPATAKMTGTPNAKVRSNIEKILPDDYDTGTGLVMGDINPVPLLLTVRPVPGYPLYTTVSIPLDAVLSTWVKEAWLIGVACFVLCLAIGIITWLLRRQVRAQAKTASLRAERDEATTALREMEAIAKAKSEFLAHMSHELRTPLNAIIGFSEIMRGEMLGPVGTPQYKGYVNDIYNCGTGLLVVVNDILDFTNSTAGRLQITCRPVSLKESADTVVGLLREEAKKAGVSILADISATVRPVVADDQRLRQVLINLVGNAIKFTRAGGTISILAHDGDSRVRLTVQDDGIGMKPEALASVFQPFGRVARSDVAEEGRGAGLGLAISKQLIELMGGTLKLESAPDKGTTATIELALVERRQGGRPTAIAA